MDDPEAIQYEIKKMARRIEKYEELKAKTGISEI